jgi:hypothetical protein
MRITFAMLAVLGGLLLSAAKPGRSAQVVVKSPELTVTASGNEQTAAFPGGSYDGLTLAEDGLSAKLTLVGQKLTAGSKKVAGQGISQVSWTLVGKNTQVEFTFAAPPKSTLLNAVQGTPARPRTPQVLAGFIFDSDTEAAPKGRSVLGARTAGSAGLSTQPGTYELPQLPPAHYSDALVTLKVQNAEFTDVLFLLSQIGNVSIVLDPYYNDEPTGSQRGGLGGDGAGGGGDSAPVSPGQPPAIFPREGTGTVTLNFKDVPFDRALDMLLMTSGLVKADIYPRG